MSHTAAPHGGKRSGAGRPRNPDPGRAVSVRLTADELAVLARISPDGVSAAIHRLIASAAFGVENVRLRQEVLP